ncbi:MAG TPA: sigma-70 family RNA polymerase sigma factor [Ktedonobacterales bacterium]
MQEHWPDDTLWQGLATRDARALEALIMRYSREVAYFVRMVLEGVGTAQDTEECVSDLFIAAWDEIDTFDPARGTLRTWLTMRAKYLALDRRRQLQRRQAHAVPLDRPSEAFGATDSRAANEVPRYHLADSESLEGMLVRREQQEQLRAALDELPELDRLLVYMRYFRLSTTEEIAARTSLTRRAIDTRLWRARKTLRDTIEAQEQRARLRLRPPATAQDQAPAPRPAP